MFGVLCFDGGGFLSVFLYNYVVVSLIVAVLDVVLAITAFKKGTLRGKALGGTCVGCALVDLSYLGSALVKNYFLYSCLSSIYFICIDFMLVCLVVFALDFCKMRRTSAGKAHFVFAAAFITVEILMFAINPFKEVAISYVQRNTPFAIYSYDMHFWFYVHLTFCYAMVGTVVYFLIRKVISVPMEYKRQYLYASLGVVAIVGVNAVFLFLPYLSVYNFLDYSILGYSVGAYVFYWACFQYSSKGMLKLFKMSIFENIDQGLVLFDNADQLILHNEVADRQWPNVVFSEMMSMENFKRQCKLDLDSRLDACVLQCYSDNAGESKPLRCEFRTLKNKKNRVLGHLFTFSNAQQATDPLTGFHNWDDFCYYLEDNKNRLNSDIVVVACDVIALSFINNTRGRLAGDQKLKNLADLVRMYFPREAYFVRGQDANFVIMMLGSEVADAVQCIENVRSQIDVSIQYAVNQVSGSDNLFDGIQDTLKALKQKKLMNKDSAHSMILNSLVQALQECDSDTEEHVRRTQLMGAELGKRIGLSDVQQSDLSLLCLLHDIGKIGVPLEILNKPGKLTPEEWDVLRSHSVKGYQIAKSSSELSGIADMILHHHERWDGGGYPDGLTRESIPLLSRVIAVVDAYDAMVNNRSYRPALTQETALNELKRCAGSQFDPSIVAEFIKLVESLPQELAVAQSKASGNVDRVKSMVHEEMNQSFDSSKARTVHKLPFSRYVVDEQFNIVSVDKAFEELTGYTQEDVINNHMNHLSLVPEDERTEYLGLVMEETSTKSQAFFEHRLVRKDGTIIYVFCIGRQFYDSAARAGRSEIVVTDASASYSLRVMADVERNKARRREAEWENAFRKDALTGVLTRSAFKNDTEFKLLEGKSKVMLLMVDVDHFKGYNDTYGHVAGDEFLTLVGQTLLSCLRRDDIAGRMGGDEFAAALFFKKDCTDEFMYQRAQQIFDKVNMILSMSPHATSLSMGAVIANEEVSSFSDLYDNADKRLYKSKEGGRSRLSVN